MLPLICLLALTLAPSAQFRVEVRNSEVWLIRNGQATQLTHDRKAKVQAALSPTQDRIAYYEQCPEAEHCMPSVIILDLEGRRLASFEPKLQAFPPEAPCASILSIVWVGSRAMGVECHINPSLSEYVETDLQTGQTTRDLLGFDFEPSPNGQHMAHVGWMPHFAPPYAKSYYLQIDRTTVYPLPPGMKPFEQENASFPPQVVLQHGLTYSGIHEFRSRLSWSPDSQRIAFIDCTYDWTANTAQSMSAGDGKQSQRRCSLAVISQDGGHALIPLPAVNIEEGGLVRVSWASQRQLTLRTQNELRTFNLP